VSSMEFPQDYPQWQWLGRRHGLDAWQELKGLSLLTASDLIVEC
jgi:hypothetical protein